MRAAPIPRDEAARLDALYELELLDNDSHEMFEGAADLAAQVFGSRIALISLVDADRQWFAAKHNFGPDQTSRDISFCGHAINGRSVMVIPDARLDSRFRDNPLVTNDAPVVFYAGAPLITPDNLALGTLCVIDHEPKYPTERQVRALEQLAKFVADQMELRRMMLRKEREARESIVANRQEARRLLNMASDLRTALNGMVGSTELIESRAVDETVKRTATALKHSALSLVQITEQLSTDGLRQMTGESLTLSSVNPLVVGAAALSVFGAEAERRNVDTGISVDPGANINLFTDQERLRLTLFHAIGFMLAQIQDGHLQLHLSRCEPGERVDYGVTISGLLQSDMPFETLQAILRDDRDNQGDSELHSLHTVRDLCNSLQGRASLEVTKAGWELKLNLPILARTKSTTN